MKADIFERLIYMSGGALLFAFTYMTTPDIFKSSLHLFLIFLTSIVFISFFLKGKFDHYFSFVLETNQNKTLLARLGILAIIFSVSFVLLLVYRIIFS